jgi:hypothetical protein
MTQAITRAVGMGWFYGRWKKILSRLDKKAIESSARELEHRHEGVSREALAKKMVSSASRSAAFVGVATATPSLVPVIGTAVSILGVVPEEIYLIHRQCELVLRLAALYHFDLEEEERLYEVIMLAGTPSRSIEAAMTAKSDLRNIAAKASAHLADAARRGTAVGMKTASRGIIRRLPALGFFVGGALNYYSFKTLGKKASTFYKLLDEERLARTRRLPEQT